MNTTIHEETLQQGGYRTFIHPCLRHEVVVEVQNVEPVGRHSRRNRLVSLQNKKPRLRGVYFDRKETISSPPPPSQGEFYLVAADHLSSSPVSFI